MQLRELERVIITGVNRLLLPRRYSRRGTQWYYFGTHWISAIEYRYHDAIVVIKLARFDRRLVRDSHPDLSRAIERTGMTWLVDDPTAWDRARVHTHWQSAEDAREMIELVERFALPQLSIFESE